MKRFTLLMSLLIILSIAVSSPTKASPVTSSNKLNSTMSVLYRYMLQFVGSYPLYVEIVPVGGDRDDGLVGGDADDYANGRGDGGGEIDDEAGKNKLRDLWDNRSGMDDKKLLKAYGRR